VGRKFNWAFSACVTLGLIACGGGSGPQGALIDSSGGASGISNNNNNNSGGSAGDLEETPGVAGDTSGFIDETPTAGAAGCSGGSCGGTDDPGGGGTLCGNGELDPGEQCDDGNARAGDGCTGACNLEPNFACNTVGSACVSTIACGDGVVGGTEACDDGGTADGDGCSATCTVEPNFGCTTGSGGTSSCGRPCRTPPPRPPPGRGPWCRTCSRRRR